MKNGIKLITFSRGKRPKPIRNLSCLEVSELLMNLYQPPQDFIQSIIEEPLPPLGLTNREYQTLEDHKIIEVREGVGELKKNERKVTIEGNRNILYIKLTPTALQVRKDLHWIYNITNGEDPLDANAIAFGSKEYRKIIQNFRKAEKVNHAPIFQGLLNKLNMLSDEAAQTIIPLTGFKAIEYDADTDCGGYAVYGTIAYARNAEPFSSKKYLHVKDAVPKGYTGFTFDRLNGKRLNEVQALHFEPKRVRIPVTPKDLGQIVISEKKLQELQPLWQPTTQEFFSNCKDMNAVTLKEVGRIFPDFKRGKN